MTDAVAPGINTLSDCGAGAERRGHRPRCWVTPGGRAMASMLGSMDENGSHRQCICGQGVTRIQPAAAFFFPLDRLLLQQRLQELSRVRLRIGRQLRRRAHADDRAAALAALGAEVDEPVRRLDHVEVVFDHHDRVALVAQPVEHLEQLRDIVEMQAGGGLIQDVERLTRRALGELASELHALGFAARQRRRVLAETQVSEPDVDERLQLAGHGRHGLEEAQTPLPPSSPSTS